MPLIPPSPSHSPTLIDRHQAMPTTMMDHKADEKRREFADTDSDEHLEIDERGVRSRHPSEPPHFLLTEPISFDLQEDYQNNVNARLQNPLYGLSREGLSKKVALFTQQSGLVEERELFEKAAILAQHPELFEEHELLDEDDKYHLRRETTHKWKQPFALCESPRHPSYDIVLQANLSLVVTHRLITDFTVAICSLSAAVQGWDQTGSNGANLGFPQALGINKCGPVWHHSFGPTFMSTDASPFSCPIFLQCDI